MTLPLPISAAIDVQVAFRDVDRRLLQLERDSRTANPVTRLEFDQVVRALREETTTAVRKATFLDFNDVFRGSGPAHSLGYVPDPGVTPGTSRFLREDGTWNTPSMAAAGGWTDDGTVVRLTTATDFVGIGTVTPIAPLEVSSANATGPTGSGSLVISGNTNRERLEIISIGGGAGTVQGYAGGGTVAAPTQTLTGSVLLRLGGTGWDNTNAKIIGNPAAVVLTSAENFTTAAHGAYITLETTPLGSLTRFERVRVDPSGNVGIGTTSFGSGAPVLGLVNAATVPTVIPTSGVAHYSSSGKPRVAAVYGNATVLGVISKSSTQVGSAAGGADTDFHTFTIKANTLLANGDTIRIRGHFFFQNNANAKSVKIKVGGMAAVTIFTGALTNLLARVDAVLFKTGANAQLLHVSSGISTTTNEAWFFPTEVDTADIVFKFQAAGVAANDAVQYFSCAEVL
jgi:hypothetical protein